MTKDVVALITAIVAVVAMVAYAMEQVGNMP
jgi:hypothetical protein